MRSLSEAMSLSNGHITGSREPSPNIHVATRDFELFSSSICCLTSAEDDRHLASYVYANMCDVEQHVFSTSGYVAIIA